MGGSAMRYTPDGRPATRPAGKLNNGFSGNITGTDANPNIFNGANLFTSGAAWLDVAWSDFISEDFGNKNVFIKFDRDLDHCNVAEVIIYNVDHVLSDSALADTIAYVQENTSSCGKQPDVNDFNGDFNEDFGA
jgi:hypothetical protein